MNYIAHIHLAKHTNTSVVGNFLGDFVKGNDLQEFSSSIQHGVRLHRKIDSFTDSHALIADLRKQFPSSLRRMSGIVLDVYFDHLLCLHWSKFNQDSLQTTLDDFYKRLSKIETPLMPRFSFVKARLLEYRWLSNYHHKEHCLQAFKNIEKRLRHKVEFAEESMRFVNAEHIVLEQTFLAFYPILMAQTKTFSKQILIDFN